MTRIRVLHVIPTLSSGGAERQLVNLVSSTDPNSIEHLVCVIDDADFFAPRVLAAGHRVIELNIHNKRPFLRAAKAIRRVIEAEMPDLVHTWLYDANVSTRLAMLGRKQIPMLTSLQLADYEPEAARIGGWNPTKVRVLKAIDRFTSSITKPHFVPCSEFVRRSYQKHFGVKSTEATVIFNSVDIAGLSAGTECAANLRREFGLGKDAFVYLNVGRLDPQKNHRTLFDAFELVLAQKPDSCLLLAGVGGLEKELKRRIIDQGIEANVLFLGRRNDIGALLSLADVFVFPSFFEGLPVALAEAMIKGRACIASRIAVFEEIIEDRKTGLLVDPTSASELAGSMIELQNDLELRQRLGADGERFAKEHFDAKVTARKWEILYREIASRSHA